MLKRAILQNSEQDTKRESKVFAGNNASGDTLEMYQNFRLRRPHGFTVFDDFINKNEASQTFPAIYKVRLKSEI